MGEADNCDEVVHHIPTDPMALLARDITSPRAKRRVIRRRRQLDLKVGFVYRHRPSELKSQ